MIHISRRLKIWLIVLAALLVVTLGTAYLYTSIGTIGDVGSNGEPLSASDISSIPQSVIDDAKKVATELCGNAKDKYDALYNQLLGLYLEAENKDVIVVFNSGGWGWNVAENAEGWFSILNGIKSELQSFGQESLLLNYQRTENNLRAYADELVELLRIYPTKAKYLAMRVSFLTSHIPDLNVILAGESNGTVISDGVMIMLQDNGRVYSIHTGPPFWHKPVMQERTLVLESNGVTPDTFSNGDVPAMLWASAKALFGFIPRDEDKGRILSFLSAPGHDYNWEYPAVCTKITGFLEKNFCNNGQKS